MVPARALEIKRGIALKTKNPVPWNDERGQEVQPPKAAEDDANDAACNPRQFITIRYAIMKRFLHILTGIATMAACLLLIPPVLAQDTAVQDTTAKKLASDRMDHNLKWITERLDLTDEQAASVKAIFEEHKQSLKELGERRRAMQDELKNSLGEVLTEEQIEKMGKRMSGDRNRRGKTMKGKHGGDRGKHMRDGHRDDGERGGGRGR